MSRPLLPTRGTESWSANTATESRRRSNSALSPSACKTILALGDVAIVAVALGAALATSLQLKRWNPELGTESFMSEAVFCAGLAALWLFLGLINGAYDTTRAYRLSKISSSLMRTTAEAGGLYLIAYFALSRPIFGLTALGGEVLGQSAAYLPRIGPALTLITVPVFMLAWRLCAAKVLTSTMFRQRTLVVGTTPGNLAFVSKAQEIALHHDFVGIVWTPSDHHSGDPKLAILGRAADLPDLVEENDIDLLVCCATNLDTETNRALQQCREQGVAIRTRQSVYEELFSRLPITTADDASRFSAAAWTASRQTFLFRAFKRGADISCSLIGLAVTAALFLPIAAAIKANSKGSVWHTQRRVGKGGREFTIIKFRTMVEDAEKQGVRWAADDDPRVTRVGRFLRRSRLDELPQFFNVWRGDMSIVGPRPERPEITQRLEQSLLPYRARLVVRPGLTGWAQTNYPYGNSVEDAQIKLEFDLYYVKNCSPALDLLIILRTWSTLTSFSGT